MLVIRFLRTGKKNQPFFRIIVTDKKNPPKGGRFLEILGFLNPQTKEKNLKKERIKYWLSVGVQPSASVHNLLVSEKIIKGEKISVHHVRKSKSEEKKTPEVISEEKTIKETDIKSEFSNVVHKKKKRKKVEKEKTTEEKPKEVVEEKKEEPRS